MGRRGPPKRGLNDPDRKDMMTVRVNWLVVDEAKFHARDQGFGSLGEYVEEGLRVWNAGWVKEPCGEWLRRREEAEGIANTKAEPEGKTHANHE